MSMFDHLRSHYPLPAHEDMQSLEYQTKSLGNLMDNYTLRADGTLWVEDFDIEDRSDPNAPTALGKLAGLLTRVNSRPRWRNDFSGVVRFYADYGPRNKNGFTAGWIEFEGVFAAGQIRSLELVEDRVPPEIAAEREAVLLTVSTPEAVPSENLVRRM